MSPTRRSCRRRIRCCKTSITCPISGARNPMPAVLKSRVVSALLLWLMLAPLADARSADAPLRKALAAAQESDVIPGREPRPLSRREIFQAIQNDLAQMGISGRGG